MPRGKGFLTVTIIACNYRRCCGDCQRCGVVVEEEKIGIEQGESIYLITGVQSFGLRVRTFKEGIWFFV